MGNCRPAFLLLLFVTTNAAWGQSSKSTTASSTPSPTPTPLPHAVDESHYASDNPVKFLRNLGRDQKQIWTSPFKARVEDLNWIVPLAGVSIGLINADAELSSRIKGTSSLGKHSSTISNGGVALLLGGSGSLYLLGKFTGDPHKKETGILAVEAATNSLVVGEVLKAVTQRARPDDGNHKGDFFNSTSISNSSFPSIHALLAWSSASVLAHEYPGPLTQILAYGLATGVSVARVSGRNHFPSDVVVGSAMGWLIGRQAYKSHHNPELPGAGYGTFVREPVTEGFPSAEHGSPYVPIDYWVYPAFDRLAALGVLNSGIVGLRPWTRKECSRLVEEISGEVDESNPDEAWRLYSALAREFSSEVQGEQNEYIGIDSVYARVNAISGPPLTDGFHFGQTIVNDYGRPYQRGTNGLGGLSTSGVAGALAFSVRGEYEHAPSAAGFSQAVQNAIQVADAKGSQPASAIPAFNQFRLLDAYISLNIKGWQTSFGKQTLWLGPTQDPFLWSNNAEPVYMLRVDQTHPSKLPSILGRLLGPFRTEYWIGKLTGAHWVNTQDPVIGEVFVLGRTLPKQPMVNGFKVNFKPTRNFEFGVGRTGVFGGPDFPITIASVKHSLFSTSNSIGRGQDPGDRRSTFDFTYRIPGFRKWLTLYDDSFVEDEISPIGYPRRAAHNPGIYLSQLPGISHMDFRAEAAFTNLPGLIQPPGGGFFYSNTRYLDGYTNQGNILGNATVGRQGIALRFNSTYWVASDKTIQLGYRSEIADSMFLQGGNLRDVYVKSEWALTPKVSLSSFLQYEWWNFPLLSAGKKQNDFTASFQLTYWPHWRLKRGN
ncbi:MAG TPA: capsule assembly Wzi family protein [Candidatus Angelobacter sp.]|nr:capsule assembly Wzi family protein [Candidatus Angelobacter sp.]